MFVKQQLASEDVGIVMSMLNLLHNKTLTFTATI
jgi:hypothetical protein